MLLLVGFNFSATSGCQISCQTTVSNHSDHDGYQIFRSVCHINIEHSRTMAEQLSDQHRLVAGYGGSPHHCQTTLEHQPPYLSKWSGEIKLSQEEVEVPFPPPMPNRHLLITPLLAPSLPHFLLYSLTFLSNLPSSKLPLYFTVI